MPTESIIKQYEKAFISQIAAQKRAVSAIFEEFSRSITPMLTRYKSPGSTVSDIWHRNKDIESAIDTELRKLQKKLTDFTTSQMGDAWNLSADKTDKIISEYIKGLSISDIARDGLFDRNLAALKELQKRQVSGMDLSQRVWKICDETKGQMELYLASGLSTGRSAAEISRDVRTYLKNPDARFRRVRDPETGILKPSKPMANYHPGRGVYRSAFKNALRLTRTETNGAYRLSDQFRWKQADFVTGYEVKLSNSHPTLDICDYMKGEYPKTFFFEGWHANCYCYCVPIMLSQNQFIDYLKTDKIPSGAKIKGVPPGAAKFVKDNADKLNRLKNKPRWLSNNFTPKGNGVFPKAVIQKPPIITGAIKENPINSIPVSEAFQKIDAKISSSVKNALSAINNIHSDGRLPVIPVNATGRMKANGTFMTSGPFGHMAPHSINIKPSGNHKELSFIHELGHFIDFSAVGRQGTFETLNGSAFTKVLNKIKSSDAYTKLIELKTTSTDYRVRDYVKYLMDERELWARSYAQYIAEKSNNKILLTQLEKNRNLAFPFQWSETDFKGIKEEIDILFKELGWL